MRYVKFFITGLLVLFILLTLIGLLMPSSVTVGRSVEIKAPLDSIRLYTNNPANWRYWINGADTAFYKQLTWSTTQKNSRIKFGTYTVTIVDNEPEYITTVWQASNSRTQLNRLELNHTSSDSINVSWSFTQQLNWYFWERLSAMLRDKIFGPSMEVSLAKLKQVCEK